ncbi:SH3 domain-containing protein [Dongshaea marina]|uniref:hypothetical protein n=1 Tax=Dongshaea marina TaxID=2047966 RepID=UPI000D3E9974|nr:hypothetical protein [Dongshaea marina]
MNRYKLAFTTIAALSLVSAFAWAGTDQIKLYEKPSASSHVIESLHPDAPLVSIFQKADWVKVGDPSNGNTGWIKLDSQPQKNDQSTKTIKTKNGTRTFTKGVVQTPQGPMHYEIVQYQGKPVSGQSQAKLFKTLQAEQLKMNDIFANSWTDMDKMQTNMVKYMAQQQKQMNQLVKEFNQPAKASS